MFFVDVNLQVAIDVGSSTVARSVVSLVIGYLNSLVIEMAFLMQVLTGVFSISVRLTAWIRF